MQKLFSLVRYHLLIFVCISITLGRSCYNICYSDGLNGDVRREFSRHKIPHLPHYSETT